MDAELKNLKIDRSPRRSGEASKWAVRWIAAGVALIPLAGAWRMVAGRFSAAPNVEVHLVAFVSDEQSKNSQPQAKSVLLIPTAALSDGAVSVLLDGKAVKRAVKTGAASGQSVRVEQGLVGGEDLIVNPPSRLKDGAKERQ